MALTDTQLENYRQAVIEAAVSHIEPSQVREWYKLQLLRGLRSASEPVINKGGFLSKEEIEKLFFKGLKAHAQNSFVGGGILILTSKYAKLIKDSSKSKLEISRAQKKTKRAILKHQNALKLAYDNLLTNTQVVAEGGASSPLNQYTIDAQLELAVADIERFIEEQGRDYKLKKFVIIDCDDSLIDVDGNFIHGTERVWEQRLEAWMKQGVIPILMTSRFPVNGMYGKFQKIYDGLLPFVARLMTMGLDKAYVTELLIKKLTPVLGYDVKISDCVLFDDSRLIEGIRAEVFGMQYVQSDPDPSLPVAETQQQLLDNPNNPINKIEVSLQEKSATSVEKVRAGLEGTHVLRKHALESPVVGVMESGDLQRKLGTDSLPLVRPSKVAARTFSMS